MKAKKTSVRQWTFCCFVSIACSLFGVSTAWTQDENEIPDPQQLQLETKDGVQLNVHYYPGTHGKESVPVILLHGWGDDHRKMVSMAGTLQRQFGFACIVPDLRGHGESMKNRNGEDLDRDRWRGDRIGAAIEDIEACKNHLISENNKGNLNIDMLAVVGDGYSSILCSIWTLRDWSYSPLGSLKQGQDVKAVILLNPTRNFKGLGGTDAYRDPLFTGRSGGAFPVIVASERDNSREAKNIYEGMLRGRKALEGKNKHINLHRYEIEGQRRMIKSRKNGDKAMDQIIGDFIQKEVYDRKHDFRWAERKSK